MLYETRPMLQAITTRPTRLRRARIDSDLNGNPASVSVRYTHVERMISGRKRSAAATRKKIMDGIYPAQTNRA